ncbi:endonuclease domain-containing protein [Methanoculleus sp.]|jgi:hypothetical protein|uniref:endonuclease domain-containing protein n=1 Tax=Methanoculleus sp. TaxID=90427 RepID=UPI0025F9BD04|nr:endonuclease domain-containing protein [Methanoculleus sp.]MCK9319387.1 endonuclease VII domain-containing protein [Methanoculleus sp.]
MRAKRAMTEKWKKQLDEARSKRTFSPLSEATKQKQREASLGKKQTEEAKQKCREAKLGDKNPAKRPEVREKIANTLKNRIPDNMKKGTKFHQQEKIAGRARPIFCEICRSEQLNGRKMCYDHDHKTGNFRGWICTHCNIILGHANDNPEYLLLLVDYLKRNA